MKTTHIFLQNNVLGPHSVLKWFRLNSLRLLIPGLLTLSSCESLVEHPVSSLTPETFYATPAQVESAFAASMHYLWTAWEMGYAYGAIEVFANDDQYDESEWGPGRLIIAPDHGKNLWQVHYRALLNLNNAIAAMKNGSLKSQTPATVDVLMGQAKLLRAYNYFMLVRMFGDVPLLLEDNRDATQGTVVRTPIKDVYAQIMNDLTEAAAKLPATWSDQIGRPTSGVAKGLLAKVYLTMATAPLNDATYYAKAADMASQVIQSGKYGLVKDINQVFTMANKHSSEMMWSFESNYQHPMTDPEIWKPAVLFGWSYVHATPAWEQKYPEQPRKAAYLLTEINGVHYTKWKEENYAHVKKFMYDSQQDYDNYISIINFPILRYADVLLIFAEAENMAKGGPTPAAVDAVNQLIDRANGYKANPAYPQLTTALSKDAFDKAVINERNLELCFEYDRWFDLVRKRMVKEVNPEWVQNFSDADYLFPIPDIDRELNPALTQNPGY